MNRGNNNYDKVFISYAKEDIEVAKNLYEYLTEQHLDPWLDKMKLLPGQDWDYEIRKALKEADFIVLLLSKTSVAKRGYVQREYKLALQYCEEKLPSDIYIIPCKIDDCEVPDALGKYQWIELVKVKDEDALFFVTKSLHSQRRKYINENIQRSKKATSWEYEEVIIKKRDTSTESDVFLDIDITYPQFTHLENEDLFILNAYIQNIFLSIYNEFKVQQIYTSKYDTIELSYNFNVLSPELISFNSYYDRFHDGMPHPNLYISGYNYLLNPLKKITIEFLFDERLDVLKTLHQLCHAKLVDEAIDIEAIKDRDESFMFEELYKEEWDTFDNFYLSKDSLIVIFNPYKITAYALGHFHPEIKFDEILKIHPDLKLLRKLNMKNDN